MGKRQRGEPEAPLEEPEALQELLKERAPLPPLVQALEKGPPWKRFLLWLAPNLTAFIASFCIMVLELVAGRVIARYLGQSLYTWTSVIGIVLAGITIGNLLGGRLADWFRPAAVLAALFLIASGLCVAIPLLNDWVYGWDSWKARPGDVSWFVWSLHALGGGESPAEEGDNLPIPWSARIFGHVFIVFLLPATFLGAIGPVVAKMALDQGRQIGRTVGNVYAWGALGSIAGTFFTGFYLISKLGTEANILLVGMVLGLVGIIYALTRLWTSAGPAAAIVSFFSVFWAFLVPVAACLGLLLYKWGLHEGKPWPFEWVERDGRTALRERPKSRDVIYLDESDYSYIKIDRETEEKDGVEKEKIRDLVLDNLVHAHYIPGDPTDLRYDYEDIYKALTHRFAPAGNGEDLATLFVGGGGYVFPRYLRAKWPACYVEIAEIDPAVTEAVVSEFGLERERVQVVRSSADRRREGNPFWVYHMDARNHLEDLVRKKDAGQAVPEFDFIYGDAFNDYAVPFHLTTREFNDKVRKLLNPQGGIYMINIIDIYHPGRLLGAVYNTFRETFGDHVYVYSSTEEGPSDERDTYIVVGSMLPLDLVDLPGKKEPFNFTGALLDEARLETLTDDSHAGALILTDDYSPVENLLQNVVNQPRVDD